VLSLTCTFVRKSLYLAGDEEGALHCDGAPFPINVPKALHGEFLMSMTEEAKILQLSDNAGKLIGHSVVGNETTCPTHHTLVTIVLLVEDEIMCHFDSFYDLIEPCDRRHVANALKSGLGGEEEVAFVCRINLSRPILTKRPIHGYGGQQLSKV